MYAFTFHRPQRCGAVADLARSATPRCWPAAMTLLPTMKLRLAGPPR